MTFTITTCVKENYYDIYFAFYTCTLVPKSVLEIVSNKRLIQTV